MAIDSRLLEALEAGRAAALDLERGQAETPLLTHCQELASSPDHQHLSITLIALNRRLRTTALSSILGVNLEEADKILPSGHGFLSIRCGESNYSLNHGSNVSVFSTLPELIGELSRHSIADDSAGLALAEPMTIGLKADSMICSVDLHVVESPAAILSRATLLTRLSQAGGLLAVVFESGVEVSETESHALRDLADAAVMIWPIAIGDSKKSTTPFWIGRGWPSVILRQFQVQPGAVSELPDFLVQADHPLRSTIRNVDIGRRTLQAAEMLDERLRAEMTKLDARKKSTNRRIRTIEADAKENSQLRVRSEEARRDLETGLKETSERISDLNRKAMMPKSGMLQAAQSAIEDLDEEDIVQDSTSTAIKLSVAPACLDRLKRRLIALEKERIRDDLTILDTDLQSIQSRLASRLSELSNATVELDRRLPTVEEIEEAIREIGTLEIRYRGEMPKRGFMQRVGEGRQKVMMLLMSVSLFGGVLGLRRALFVGIPLIVVFVFGVLYTYRSWAKQSTERLEKELDRVRDVLRSEVKRVLNEMQREKGTRIDQTITSLQRDWARRIDDIVRDAAKQQVEGGEKERKEQQERLRTIERRIRDHDPVGRNIHKMLQATREATVSLERELSMTVARVAKGEGAA